MSNENVDSFTFLHLFWWMFLLTLREGERGFLLAKISRSQGKDIPRHIINHYNWHVVTKLGNCCCFSLVCAIDASEKDIPFIGLDVSMLHNGTYNSLAWSCFLLKKHHQKGLSHKVLSLNYVEKKLHQLVKFISTSAH